ncbi:MAG: Endonuclease III [Firmicutes bacterium]|nr:Endonuclease III [Bacillota bacterium]
MKDARLKQLSDLLIKEGYRRLAAAPAFVQFTGVVEADTLLNDLDRYPHAFVVACIMNSQIKAVKAWQTPVALKNRLGSFEFAELASLARFSPEKLAAAMSYPEPLHRFHNEMGKNLVAAIHHIQDNYGGDASAIWSGKPASAALVRRFREFRGAGQKVASMAANILVRDLRVEVSDHYAIDVSVDTHVKRVFTRMGFVHDNAPNEHFILRARECHSNYPGVFDLVLWNLGRTVCKPTQPTCEACQFLDLCAHAIR